MGVEVSFSSAEGAGGNLVVVAPAPGGPADRAGIRPGDHILSIDGQPTSTLSLYAAGVLRDAGSSTPRIEGWHWLRVPDLALLWGCQEVHEVSRDDPVGSAHSGACWLLGFMWVAAGRARLLDMTDLYPWHPATAWVLPKQLVAAMVLYYRITTLARFSSTAMKV